MNTLKITLTPTGRFFFGGETKFGDPALDQRRTTYVIHSQYFPQQTALLGMLREQLLLQNGLLRHTRDRVKDKTAAQLLIGDTGFQVSGQRNDYGAIEGLSPVYISDKAGRLWQTAPLDDCLMPNPVTEALDQEMRFRLNDLSGVQVPVLEHYSAKTGLQGQLQTPASASNEPLDRFFSPETQIGITKAARPWRRPHEADRDDEAGFFKQTFLRFHPEAAMQPRSFVFYVSLRPVHFGQSGIAYSNDAPMPAGGKFTESGFYTLRSALISMGGERSAFNMEVTAGDPPALPVAYRHRSDRPELNRIVLTSDTFVDPVRLRANSCLVVANSVSFRFLSSTIARTDHFHSLGQDGSNKLVSSKQFHLLQRGGVIYAGPDQLKALEPLLQQPDFQQIGYNTYQIL